jgi:hypothetical protein
MIRAAHILSVLIGLVANLIPLCGVLYWGWDTFQLLMLYWMETVIVAFWTIRRIARIPEDQLGTMTVNGQVRRATSAGMTGFFTLHAGVFIFVHLVFLFVMFSGEWLKKVHGVGSFFSELLLANGVWVALLVMFAAGWISYLLREEPSYPRTMERGLYPKAVKDSQAGDAIGAVIGGLYVRIVVLQVGIIFGAMFAQGYGSMAPLLIVIGLKTIFDFAATWWGWKVKGMTVSSSNTSVRS